MNNINMDHLLYLITIADEGSIKNAAIKLKKDRTTISTAISNLQIDLGVEVFERAGRNLTLTEEGRHLYKRARVLIENYQDFQRYSLNISSKTEASVTILVDSFTNESDMLAIESQLVLHFPNTLINWKYVPTNKHNDLILNNEADVAIRLGGNEDLTETLTVRQLDTFQNHITISKDTLAASLKYPYDLPQLRMLPAVMPHDLQFATRFDRFPYIQFTSSFQHSARLLTLKPCWTLLPDNTFKSVINDSNLTTIEINDVSSIYFRRVIFCHHQHARGKVVNWLLDNVQFILRNV